MRTFDYHSFGPVVAYYEGHSRQGCTCTVGSALRALQFPDSVVIVSIVGARPLKQESAQQHYVPSARGKCLSYRMVAPCPCLTGRATLCLGSAVWSPPAAAQLGEFCFVVRTILPVLSAAMPHLINDDQAHANLERAAVCGNILGELVRCLAYSGISRRPRNTGVWSCQLERRSGAHEWGRPARMHDTALQST